MRSRAAKAGTTSGPSVNFAGTHASHLTKTSPSLSSNNAAAAPEKRFPYTRASETTDSGWRAKGQDEDTTQRADVEDTQNDEDDDGWEGLSEDEADEAMDGPSTTPAAAKRRKELAKLVRVRKAGAEGPQKMKMQTLKTRPGSMKRKSKLEGMERERFGRNLAQMSAAPAPAASVTPTEGTGGGAAAVGSTSQRWAALRGFIGSTMEMNPNFKRA
ncbi:hypothetical protein H2203_003849 [Taxawa tesnikishii (nom. ined.)]|nr:hypothetical protein H2203_003849 [Dothideales sp. JES 119]